MCVGSEWALKEKGGIDVVVVVVVVGVVVVGVVVVVVACYFEKQCCANAFASWPTVKYNALVTRMN